MKPETERDAIAMFCAIREFCGLEENPANEIAGRFLHLKLAAQWAVKAMAEEDGRQEAENLFSFLEHEEGDP